MEDSIWKGVNEKGNFERHEKIRNPDKTKPLIIQL